MFRLIEKKGFTLIELLVVIAIIGILASVVLSSLNDARASARDTTRIQTIKQVQTALEMYRLSTGDYPIWQGSDTRQNSCFSNGNGGDGVAQWSSALNVLVTQNIFTQLPRDPLNNSVIGARPAFCFGYHRDNSTSTFNACRNKTTNELYLPRDYEYLLYFSTENPDRWDVTLHWNNNSSKPFNACLVGPRR